MTACMPAGDMKPPSEFPETENVEGRETSEETRGNSQTSETTEATRAETSETLPPISTKQTVKFIAVGDALIHSAIYREAQSFASSMSGYAEKYYFNSMYDNIADEVKNADIAFVNHEAPIANSYISGYPTFNAPSQSGDALVGIGFNVVNVANNHMFDSDSRCTGYADTIDYWSTKKVLQIGGYKSSSDYEDIRIMNVEGDINIAFLSYTTFVNPGTKMNSTTVNAGYVAPYAEDATIIRHLAAAKKKADLVFVSMHWGTENVFTATAEQKRLAQLIADNGADVIIGHHSHTVQPVEWITGRNGNKTLCVYSLGNFISGMLSPKNMVGGMMTFDIVKENGKVYIDKPVFKPTVCHYDIADFSKKDPEGNPVRTGFKVYMMEDYTEAMAKKHGTQNYGGFTLSTLQAYVKNTVSAEFLPDYLK